MDRLSRMEMIRKLLDEEPADVFLNYALGVEYLAELDLAEAEACFKKVLTLKESYIPVYYQLGKLYEAKSEEKEALKYYTAGHKFAEEQNDRKAMGEFDEAIFMLGD